jgi:Fe(3+) dicitrate transport protein
VLPGAAIAWGARPWLTAFGGLHRGFSPVAPGAAPDTPPETAWNGELGVRAFPAFGWGTSYAELTAFGSDYANLVGTCTLSAGCVEQDLDRPFVGGRARVGGVEATLAQDLSLPRGFGLRAEGAWTWTRAVFVSTFESGFPQWGDVRSGDALPYVPTHQGSARVTLRRGRGSIGATVVHRGAMRDAAGSGVVDARAHVPASTVLDVDASWGVRGVGLYLLARNALDAVTVESLRPFGVRPGVPRTVIVGLKVEPGADGR